MKKDIWPLQWLLLFVRFPLMISVFQGVWGRTEETFSCVYVVFLRPCFLTSRFNFLTQFSSCCVCLHQAAIICHFRNPLFIHLPERNALLFWPTVFAPVWSVCVKQSSGRFTHTKTLFPAKSGNDRFKDGPLQAKLTETLFKRHSNGLISREQRSWCWFIAGAIKTC